MSCPNHDMRHCVDIDCNDTHINIEDDPCHVDIDGMENAYAYELWSCFGIVTKIKKLIDQLFSFFEAVTEDEVKDMWKD